MTYPNGQEEEYVYTSGIDNAISRITAIGDHYNYTDPSSSPLNVESYTYLGLDTIVGRAQGDGDSLSIGLDNFGRINDMNWSGTNSDHFEYAYDHDGNVLYKKNDLASSFSELYHANSSSSGDDETSAYDLLNRLKTFRRGTLSVSGGEYNGATGLDTVTTLNTVASDDSATYSLDALGNKASVNKQNQLTGSDYAYDNNGNMTEDATGDTYQ